MRCCRRLFLPEMPSMSERELKTITGCGEICGTASHRAAEIQKETSLNFTLIQAPQFSIRRLEDTRVGIRNARPLFAA